MADTTMGSGAFHLDFSFANYVEFLRDRCAWILSFPGRIKNVAVQRLTLFYAAS